MRTQETKQVKTFELYRPLLFSIAYRMLGSVMEAEDMVQETYLRYSNASTPIESPKAFLTTITTRLCLDRLKSAKRRREEYIGPWLPEPLRTDEAALTPLDKYEMISMAALVLLENLSPLERAVFLLREVFDYDYTEIAGIVEKSETNCRQIYHRAKQYLQQHRPRFKPSPAAQHKLATGFLQAIQTGDVEGLTALLTKDATLWSDGGGKASAARHPVVGKERIARLLLVSYRKRPDNADIELAEVNGVLSILYRVADQVIGVMSFGGNETGITDIWTVWNPDKLQHLQ
ncbi:MAG: RNA polymerase sigma-70 factor [Anaerolineae bacterium]|nr:RNA polymerase sigma-70 factor [Anaerolineae bacterium]